MNFEGKKVLVFGGLGFIGLNLVRRLSDEGSFITILDHKIQPQVKFKNSQITYLTGDILDKNLLKTLIKDNEILFNLAGKSGSVNSMKDPIQDLEINCLGVLNILEAAREANPNIKIVFPGSRLEFGRVEKLPVNEDQPMNPTSIYGIHKLTAEKYHLAYFANFGLRSTVFRISNPYGPHLRVENPGYNIINYFFDLACDDETLKVFGDGSQKRDYLFIDDLIDLFLLSAVNEKSDGQVYNVGSGVGISLLSMAKTIVEVVGSGRVDQVPWDEKLLKLETGDYVSDITKVKKDLGWEPKFTPKKGIEKTLTSKADSFWKSE